MAAFVLTSTTGCDPTEVSCHPLVEEGSRCVCPAGTTRVDDWACALPDGGVLERPGRPDGSMVDAGVDAGADVFDARGEDAPASCTPADGACNGRDDDCDGLIDEDADGQCPAIADGVNACLEGACMLVSCEAGFEECRSEGLCTWTDESPVDCGACGTECDADQACSSGDCVDSWGTGSVAVAGTGEQDFGGEVASAGNGSYWSHRIGSTAYTSLLAADGSSVWRRPVPVPVRWDEVCLHASSSSFFALGRNFLAERVESDFGDYGGEARQGHKVGVWSRTPTGEPRWLSFFESTVSVAASAAFNDDDEACIALVFRGRLSYRGETLVGSSIDEDTAVVCMDTESGDVSSVFPISGPGSDQGFVLALLGDDVLLRVTTTGDLPWGDRTLGASSFIARIGRDGSPSWQIPFVATGLLRTRVTAAADEELVALAFYVPESLSMHGITFRYNVSPGSNGMMALIALDPATGGLRWTAASSRSNFTRPVALELGRRGIHVLASFGDEGGLPMADPPLGPGRMFLARFARDDGALTWAQAFGGELDYPRDMSCDSTGRCRVSFDFSGSTTYFGEEYVAAGIYDSAVLTVEVE